MPQDKSPAPRQPYRPSPFLRSMQREMGEFLDRVRDMRHLAPGDFLEDLTAPMFPAIDVSENDDVFEITAEVPGVKEDDLDVSITRDVLTLKGSKSSAHEESDKDFHIVERRYGSFHRQVPLGFTPEDDAVAASFSDGVLTLKITKPKSPRDPVRKIKVTKD